MRVAVIGSRRLCVDIAAYIPDETTAIVTCEMPGIGMLASGYADKSGMPKLIIKEAHMGSSGWHDDIVIDAAETVLALWDGCSPGTARAIEYARTVGKPIKVHVIAQ